MASKKTQTSVRKAKTGQFVILGASQTSAVSYYASNPTARKAASKSFRARTAATKVTHKNSKQPKVS